MISLYCYNTFLKLQHFSNVSMGTSVAYCRYLLKWACWTVLTAAAKSQTGSQSSFVSQVLSAQDKSCYIPFPVGTLLIILLSTLLIIMVLTSPLSSFDIQELASMSSHHIPLHQWSDGTDVPQSLIKRKQLRGKVERSKTSNRTAKPALLFIRQRWNCTSQQCIRLHRGAQEWVGILENVNNSP